MTSETKFTYCRLCPATCGLVVQLSDGVVTKITGDEEHALTRGFTCTKGRHLADFCTTPARLRESQRKVAPGRHEPVAIDVAIGEIAARLSDIIDTHGPDAVALYTGTQAAYASLTLPFTLAFWKTIGSRKKFSSMTVDQAAKWVAEGRLGRWAAGSQRLADANVWMFVGTNPLVSMQGGYFTGFPIHDGMRRLAEEKRRGLQLIVVDPRRTELATRADIHLQIIPGTDAALFAGFLHVLLAEGLFDGEFCARWAPDIDGLRAAVAAFTPRTAAAVCGVAEDDLVAAVRLFARGPRGMATGGTGPDMGPFSNLAEHLIQTINVVCGRFPQEGEPLAGAAVLGSAKALPAEVIAPDRHWQQGFRSSAGYGLLNAELPAVTLPDEIAAPADDRVRALIVVGGNPAVAVPGKQRMIDGLSSLELLVTIDPFMSETAQVADYVIAPVSHLERPDTTRAYESLMDTPFAQYTPAILPAPQGVIDDWQFLLRLAWAMGRSLKLAGREFAPGSPLPSTDDVLEAFAARARVPLAEIKQHPHGAVFEAAAPVQAAPPQPGTTAVFDIAPADVHAELAALAQHVAEHAQRQADAAGAPDERLLLIVRRAKEVMNSNGTQIAGLVRTPANPCHVHPADLQRLGLAAGDRVSLTSDHGSIDAVVLPDPTLRQGAASMTHGFGGAGLDGDPPGAGTSTNRLLSAVADLQPISGMPMLTAVPVSVGPPQRPA
ncbi:MAG: molybdopterin-dependent oxidoreductase [Actinomycetota bacterium]|nr:molybdopterin-dependent oxidoreductase [Actinomycetota bacterium]